MIRLTSAFVALGVIVATSTTAIAVEPEESMVPESVLIP